MPFHDTYTGQDIHTPIRWTYADATARGAATGFVSGDLDKLALQQSDNTIWMLSATTPTWVQIGGSGSAPGGTAGGDLTGTYPNPTLADNTVDTAELVNSAVTLAKIANIADQTILGNNSGGAAAPIALTPSQTKTVLGLGTAAVLASDTDGTLAANSDSRLATQKAVKTYIDALLAANDAMVFKGVVDCSANPNYPAADAGHTYRVSVAGKIGGASGTNVEVGDLLLCITDSTASGNQATVGANWEIVQTNLDGAMTGPASSTSSNFATFNGTSGKVIQDSGVALETDGTLAANSDVKIASQKAVKTYVAAQIAAVSGITSNQKIAPISADFNGGGSTPTVGSVMRVRVPYACTITGATVLMQDLSGSCAIEVRRCTYAQYDGGATHPVTGDKICASAPPTVTSAWKSQDTTMTGWTLTLAANDIVEFYLSSVTTTTHITIQLDVTKS